MKLYLSNSYNQDFVKIAVPQIFQSDNSNRNIKGSVKEKNDYDKFTYSCCL